VSLETDLLLDRRRLKRRLVFWRCLTVAALVAAAFAILLDAGISFGGSYVARLNVSGIITEDRKLVRALEDLAKNPDARALIVAINSPGGSVSGGESLYRAIGRVAEKKPVVAVMGGVAASAGYMVALPAERIFARDSTLTGSIGVLLETGEVSGLLDKLGISTEAITSGALKDQPSLTRPLSPQGREVLQGLVMDMYDQFVGMVVVGRKLDPSQVRAMADGRAFTGRQALKLGLIDAIGGEAEARAWLQEKKGVPASIPTHDVTTSGLAERAISGMLGSLVESIWKTLISQSVRLDGGLAVWHRSGG
jgi:protease-4